MTNKDQAEFDSNTRHIYEYIRDYIRENRYSPSLQNIADACFMSQSTVSYRIAKLEAKGWIERELSVARSLRLGPQAPDYVPEEDIA